jgi:DNA-directed RNA polymerase subunit RPC12/RpoP
MSVPGYQCQQCWGTFADNQGCGEAKNSDLKCPTCRSANVKKVELPEDWVFQGPGGLCFG